ncbi:monovalent cation/H+ antiporter complex subunit F [Rhodosalinus sp.]|uniref:monovalent cation/H+ antiporter complex subunit F n=1 Tax=Rhodosalinus sp. TaxID=2047741 RepID=UPI003563F72B
MDFLQAAINVSFFMVVLGVAFAFVRLVKGPSLPNRVVALDMMNVLIVSFCGLYAIRAGDSAFVDVAIVLALVGFLATVALARFVERRVNRDSHARDEDAETGPGEDR